jgi:hypothetical protein
MRVEYVHDGARQTPLLRFFNFTPADLADLIAAFSSLAAPGAVAVRLAPGEFLIGLNLKTLNARPSARDHGVVPLEHDTFDWVLTPQSWRAVAERARALRIDRASSFQWLDQSSSIGVLLSHSDDW